MAKHRGERFLIELEALPSDVPVPNRLRRLLKMALRGFQFRCVSIAPAPAPHVALDVTPAPRLAEQTQNPCGS